MQSRRASERLRSLLLCVHIRPFCSGQYSAHGVYGTGLLPVRKDCLPLATRKFYSVFSTVLFDVPLLLLAAGVSFLLLVFHDENILLLTYKQFRITQATDEQVEDKQDQSMKGCSHKELDKESYQQ